MISIVTLPLGPIQTNCYVVGDDTTNEAVVIDPGWDAPAVLAALEKRRWQLRGIWLTHAHFDHIGAVADLVEATGVPLALHPLELPLYRAQGGASLFGLHLPPSPEPTVMIKPGEAMTVGNLRFDVYFVPGHTVGHVAFYAAEHKALFSGDVLFCEGIGRTDLPGGDYATLMHSIKSVLFTLPDDTTVYSGHGTTTTLGEEKRFNPFLAD